MFGTKSTKGKGEDHDKNEGQESEDKITNGNSDFEKENDVKEHDLKEGSEVKQENAKMKKEIDDCFTVKEWCVYGDKSLEEPDNVSVKGNWVVLCFNFLTAN